MNVAEDTSVGDFDVFFFYQIDYWTDRGENLSLNICFIQQYDSVKTLTEIDCKDFFLLVTALLAKFGDVG